jgi:3-oxoadipate enol-lactonase
VPRRRKERRQAMGIRKRTLVAWGMAVVSLALLGAVLGMAKTARPAAAQPEEGTAVALEEGPAPVESGFADANGARLYYEVYGEGEPLLLIPGSFHNHVSWVDEVPVFAPEFKLIVFDPRGTGESSFPEGVDVTMAVMADDAAALLDALGVDAAHVLGWSMGGMVAQEMALRHPEKVRSLILGGTAPGGPHSVPAEDWATAAINASMTQGVTAPNFLEVLFSPAYLAEHRSEAIEYWARVSGGPPMAPQAIAAQVVAIARHDTYDRLPSITAPTLVIDGADDPVEPAGNSRILAERIPGAELVLVEGARHLPGTEKPAQVHAAVLDFLHRHAGQVPAPAPVATGFADANGARLYYEVYGKGEPLLLIPSMGMNHLSWAEQVPVYANEFKVIVYDPRGTGQSSFPEGVQLTTALLADDAAALLDALGIDAAHVQGWSLGGMVAQEMALRHPEKIRSLILSATSPGGPHAAPVEDSVLAAFIAGMTQGVTAPNFLEGWFSPGYLAEHRSEAIEQLHWQPDPEIPLQVLQAQLMATAGHDTYDRLPSITAPTLVLHGSDDPMLPLEDGRILAERIPGAELILFEGAGHAYMLEKQAEADAAVLDFLRQHPGQVPVPAALPAAGSGGLLTEQGSGVPVWWYALAAGGALLLAAGAWSARRCWLR